MSLFHVSNTNMLFKVMDRIGQKNFSEISLDSTGNIKLVHDLSQKRSLGLLFCLMSAICSTTQQRILAKFLSLLM